MNDASAYPHTTTATSLTAWSRVIGVPLRLWSGHSPLSLIVRGAIRVAVVVFVFILVRQLATTMAESRDLGLTKIAPWMWPIYVLLVVLGALGVLRVVVGVLDLAPRKRVTGQVVSVEDRRFLDFLPQIVQQLLFHRHPSDIDSRRVRTQVVLNTATGTRQWTIRKPGQWHHVARGSLVTLTVTPIAGFVAGVEHHPAPASGAFAS